MLGDVDDEKLMFVYGVFVCLSLGMHLWVGSIKKVKKICEYFVVKIEITKRKLFLALSIYKLFLYKSYVLPKKTSSRQQLWRDGYN
jgi:hypothetical protein